MRLDTVRVINYKCIFDSGAFSIAPVTCFVGRNESGKSALLEAIYKLNPVRQEDLDFDPRKVYPRHLYRRYKERAEAGSSGEPVVAARFELSPDDCTALENALGPRVLLSKFVVFAKYYGRRPTMQVSINESSIVRHLLSQSSLSSSEKRPLRLCETIARLRDSLSKVDSPSDAQSALLESVERQFPDANAGMAAIRVLDPRLPKFVYFASYNTLPGEIALDVVLDKSKRGDALTFDEAMFLALLGLAKTDPEALRDNSNLEEYIRTLEIASDRITEEIVAYWSQSRHLSVQFRVDSGTPTARGGRRFHTRILDSRYMSSFNVEDRSSGFVWFFSFLVWMSHVRRVYGDNVIVLLDEPGLSLHARAQADLLRYIRDRLQPRFQVMYTTHSPFMVDVEDFLGTRTVRDVSEAGMLLGTKVEDKVFAKDKDTVLPLQAALGYDVAQTLFLGGHMLVVEGPSDLLYLKWASRQLRMRDRAYLDTRWVVCPVGGIDKMRSFVALFGGNRLHVAVLADFHSGDKNKVRELRDSGLLKKGHVLTMDTYASASEGDIEDLLGRRIYVPLVNSCYGLDDDRRVPLVRNEGETRRLVEEVTDHFRALPADVESFDHYTPARHLSEHPEVAERDSDALMAALERFERLFVDLNSLLPAASVGQEE